MTMTRKDYRVVATALRISRPDRATDPGAHANWIRVRNMIATELRLSYRNFRVDKFDAWTEA